MDFTKEIESTVKEKIAELVSEQLMGLDIDNTLTDTLVEIIQEKTDVIVTRLLNNMIREGKIESILENKILKGIQEKLDKEVTNKANGIISQTDVGQIVSDRITQFVQERMKSAALPDRLIPLKSLNLDGLIISADQISRGTIKSFTSSGIQDAAKDINLTILDDAVVIEHNLITDNLRADGSATINKLEVTGQLKLTGDVIINNKKFTQDLTSLVNDKISAEKANWKLDILGDALYGNGRVLVNNESLGPSILSSNLRKVGNLTELRVTGDMSVSETLSVHNGRVGVNTDSPAGALTVWDEEAEFSVRKYKSSTTYIGTTRDCDLVIGTNGKVVMSIRRDDTVAMNSIDLGGVKLSVANSIPERSGEPGEIVIMRKATAGLPWAYQCVEGSVWVALKR